MAFFDTLRQLVGAGRTSAGSDDARLRLAEAWGLSDTSHPEFPRRVPAADPEAMAAPPRTSAYDLEQWRRRLRRLLDTLPESKSEWADFVADGRALGLDEEWMLQTQIEEFTFMIRRAVADRHFTPAEHAALDQARELIGLSEDDAESLVRRVIAEAESFFGQAVEGA